MAASTPATLMSSTTCLQCESDSELEMIELVLWAQLNGITLPTGLTTLLQNSASYTVLSKTQLRRANIIGLKTKAGNTDNTRTLMTKAKCLKCINPGQIHAAIAYLKSQYWNS